MWKLQTNHPPFSSRQGFCSYITCSSPTSTYQQEENAAVWVYTWSVHLRRSPCPPSSVGSSSRVLPAVISCISRSQVCLRFRGQGGPMENHPWNWNPRILSPTFPTGSGVRLGCVLAPALFCRAVDWILEETVSHSSLSVPYHHVTDIDYADDITTMDSSQAVLADTLQRMEGACSALGLHIS